MIRLVASSENVCVCRRRGRRKSGITDDDIALPGASVVGAEIDHLCSHKGGVFDQEGAVADDRCARVSDDGILDRAVCNALMRIESRKNATVTNTVP